MNPPDLDEMIELLDHKDESLVGGNMIELHREYSLADLVDVYVEAFYQLKNFPGRRDIAYWVGRYVKLQDNVFRMALHGIGDKSYIVRHHCCQILAFAQDDEALEHLNCHLEHKHKTTREDVAAAVDSIKCKNHNYFVDRGHTGRVFLDLGKI